MTPIADLDNPLRLAKDRRRDFTLPCNVETGAIPVQRGYAAAMVNLTGAGPAGRAMVLIASLGVCGQVGQVAGVSSSR